MLPTFYTQAYHNLLNALLFLQEQLGQPEPDLESVLGSFERLEQVFQKQILNLSSQELDPAIASRWQLGQTELYRTFRLLKADLSFWQSSRSGEKREQRLRVMSDRLEQMIGYSQAIIRSS